MKMDLSRRSFLQATALNATAAPMIAGLAPPGTPQSRFEVRGDQFVLDGKPFQILSGDMHYTRIPRFCWRDRLRKARALGLNTICTYCFWNAHEPVEGTWNFKGNLDLHAYIGMAQEEGLHVILRPGPYVCAEWDFGGFPAWLLADPNIRVRSADPKFLKHVERYFERLAREVVPLTIAQGGPILLCQIENEYGSYGDDPVYKNAIRSLLVKCGFDGAAFYTSDGPSAVLRGSFPDLPAVINFGANEDAAKQFATLDKLRPGGPRMCGEFWAGWFDHWGETHNGMTTKSVCEGLEWMISRGISVNLYMLHGGTSFGFAAGANRDRAYEPDVSSYDYDAPLDEAGVPTPKYLAIRDIISGHNRQSTNTIALPDPEPYVTIPRFSLGDAAPLWSLLAQPVSSEAPKPMEMVGQTHGALVYRTRITAAQQGTLELADARDYALVFADGVHLGTLDRRLRATRIPVRLGAGSMLEILVDTMGHVNFGPHLVDDRKGIIGSVLLNGESLRNWEIFSLPLDDLSGLQYSTMPVAAGPAFYRGRFSLPSTGYAFLDMRGWGKGYVWVNGHNLGRYWSVGPQRTLYVPAEWLHTGENEVIVLDYHPGPERSLAGRKDAVYDIDPRGARL